MEPVEAVVSCAHSGGKPTFPCMLSGIRLDQVTTTSVFITKLVTTYTLIIIIYCFLLFNGEAY